MRLWSFAPMILPNLVFGILGIGTKLCEAMVIPVQWGYCIGFLYFNHTPIGDVIIALRVSRGAQLRISTTFFLSKIEKGKNTDKNSSTAIWTPSTTLLNILLNREIFSTMVQLQYCFLDHVGYFSASSLYNAYFYSSLQKRDMYWYFSSNIGIAIVMQN